MLIAAPKKYTDASAWNSGGPSAIAVDLPVFDPARWPTRQGVSKVDVADVTILHLAHILNQQPAILPNIEFVRKDHHNLSDMFRWSNHRAAALSTAA